MPTVVRDRVHSEGAEPRTRWRPVWWVPPLIAMSAAALARLINPASIWPLPLIIAFTSWSLLPAYGVALWSLVRRRIVPALWAGTLVAAHLAWVVPQVVGGSAWVAPDEEADCLTLLSANLLYVNASPDRAARQLAAAEVDVLMVQEFTPRHAEALRSAGVDQRFAYRVRDPRPQTPGSAIFSRRPLTKARAWSLHGAPMTRAEIELGGRSVTLYNVHTGTPMLPWAPPIWARQLRALGREFAGNSGGVIAAGDFNATLHHRPFARLLDGDLRDVHQRLGRAWRSTWPSSLPLLRLDHVLASSDLTPIRAGEVRVAGSDHLGVTATLCGGVSASPRGAPATGFK